EATLQVFRVARLLARDVAVLVRVELVEDAVAGMRRLVLVAANLRDDGLVAFRRRRHGECSGERGCGCNREEGFGFHLSVSLGKVGEACCFAFPQGACRKPFDVRGTMPWSFRGEEVP